MSDKQHEELSKIFDSRKKADSEVRRMHQQINEAVGNSYRRVDVGKNFKGAMTKAIKSHDQLLALTLIVDNSASLQKAQETYDNNYWRNVETSSSVYQIATCNWQNVAEFYQDNKKNVSKRSGNSATSKTNSQRKKELLVAEHLREQLKCQHDVELRFAKQKQETEL